MDFSWGWATPGSVVTTEPLAKARLELVPTTRPQAAVRRPIVGNRPRLERREQGLHQRLRLLAFPA